MLGSACIDFNNVGAFIEKLASGTLSCESEILDSIAAEDIRRYCLRGGEFVRLHLRTKKFEVLPWKNSWFSRQGSSIVHFDGSLYVFGGKDPMYCDQNDFPTGLARYDIKKRTWTFPKTSVIDHV